MNQESVRRALDKGWSEVGPVRHFVHVVGGTRPDEWFTLDSYSDVSFDRVFAFNLRPLFQTCREVGRWMIATGSGGTIVTFASMSGMLGAPLHGPYGAAKSAVISLT